MPDSLPAVAGTVVVDINPNDFAPGTKVDGTALTAANTTPVLTSWGANPTYKDNQFAARGGIKVGNAGWRIPRPVQDDWTIYIVVKGLSGSGSGVQWWSNGAVCDAETAGGFADDFGLTLKTDGNYTVGAGNPDTTGLSSSPYVSIAPYVITYTRVKSTGVQNVYINGTLVATVTGNNHSLTSNPWLYFGWGENNNKLVAGVYARVVAYDAAHNGTDRGLVEANLAALYATTTALYIDKVVTYAALGTAALKSTKFIVYAALGVAGDILKVLKQNTYAVLGSKGLDATKVVVYAVLGPPSSAPPPEGPEPVILPPEECEDENGNPVPGCCVPDLNRVIEARVGVLNTHKDLVVAIQYLQDRHNVLVREFNKLATVTRPNPPSV